MSAQRKSNPGDINPRVAAGAALASALASDVTTLDGLTDVDTSTVAPIDGDALIYDLALGQWTPGAVLRAHQWGTAVGYEEVNIDLGLVFTASNGNFIEFEASGVNPLGFWAANPDWSNYWGIGALKPSGRRTIEGEVAFEFMETPYVLTDPVYHEGNLSFGSGLTYVGGVLSAGAGYTDEQAQDAVGTILTDTATIDFTYNDAGNAITADVKAGSIGPTQLADTAVTPGAYTLANITVDQDGRVTAAASGSVSSYSDENAQDAIGAALTDTATIDFTYNDGAGTITADVKTGSIGPTQLADTAVAPGSYTLANITVDQDGRVTAASNGSGFDFDNTMTLPVASSFTLLNGAAGTNPATLTDYGKGIAVYQALTPGGTQQVRFAKYNTAPSAGGFTLTARMHSIDPSNAFGQVSQKCLILRNATNGRMIIMGEGGTGSTIYVQIFSGYTSGQLGQYTAFSVGYRFPWLRIVSDGTNLNFYVSVDGYFWLKATAGTTVANYIGSVDEVGIGCQVNAGGLTQGSLCQSFTLV